MCAFVCQILLLLAVGHTSLGQSTSDSRSFHNDPEMIVAFTEYKPGYFHHSDASVSCK